MFALPRSWTKGCHALWALAALTIVGICSSRSLGQSPEVIQLTAQVNALKRELERLRNKMQSLEAENGELSKKLALLMEENERLAAQAKPPAKGVQGEGQDDRLDSVPLTGDETHVLDLMVNSHKFYDTIVEICGGLEISTFYYGRYADADPTHYAFTFQEADRKGQYVPKSTLYMYGRRKLVGPLSQAVVDSTRQGKAKLVRLRAALLSSRSTEKAMEILDWQFVSADRKGWGPWAVYRDFGDQAGLPRSKGEKLRLTENVPLMPVGYDPDKPFSSALLVVMLEPGDEVEIGEAQNRIGRLWGKFRGVKGWYWVNVSGKDCAGYIHGSCLLASK